jgi:hypothetical protein
MNVDRRSAALPAMRRSLDLSGKELAMSISMPRFDSYQGHFPTYDPYTAAPRRVTVFQLQCRSCGYSPEDAVTPPRLCPKCHGESWERFAQPGSILKNAARY